MWQFGWLSERGRNFLNLLQKEGGTQKGRGWGVTSEKKGRGGFQLWGKLWYVSVYVYMSVCIYIIHVCMFVYVYFIFSSNFLDEIIKNEITDTIVRHLNHVRQIHTLNQ